MSNLTAKKISDIERSALTRLEAMIDETDVEKVHGEADDVLTEFVKSLGFVEIAETYEKVPKWFS